MEVDIWETFSWTSPPCLASSKNKCHYIRSDRKYLLGQTLYCSFQQIKLPTLNWSCCFTSMVQVTTIKQRTLLVETLLRVKYWKIAGGAWSRDKHSMSCWISECLYSTGCGLKQTNSIVQVALNLNLLTHMIYSAVLTAGLYFPTVLYFQNAVLYGKMHFSFIVSYTKYLNGV